MHACNANRSSAAEWQARHAAGATGSMWRRFAAACRGEGERWPQRQGWQEEGAHRCVGRGAVARGEAGVGWNAELPATEDVAADEVLAFAVPEEQVAKRVGEASVDLVGAGRREVGEEVREPRLRVGLERHRGCRCAAAVVQEEVLQRHDMT